MHVVFIDFVVVFFTEMTLVATEVYIYALWSLDFGEY